MRRFVRAAALLAAVAAAGCSGREFAEVEGRITLDGKPLTDAEVVFLPDPAQGNRGNNASALTDADGRYRLYAPRDNRDGTVLGPHRVVVIDLLMVVDTTGAGAPRPVGAAAAAPAMPGTKPRRFSAKYGDAADTPFKDVEVRPGKQTLDFDLKSTGPGEKKS